MARPSRNEGAPATEDKLLAVASREFAKHGFEAARLSDIAEQIGIKRPSLLYHYPSKQALYTAVIRSAFADLGLALEAATTRAGAPFLERFDDLVRGLVAFFDARPDVATLLLREMVDGHGPGQALLLEVGVPILLRIERFIREEGAGHARRELPVRQSLLAVFSAVAVRSAAGPLREPLWGRVDKTRALARALFIEESK